MVKSFIQELKGYSYNIATYITFNNKVVQLKIVSNGHFTLSPGNTNYASR